MIQIHRHPGNSGKLSLRNITSIENAFCIAGTCVKGILRSSMISGISYVEHLCFLCG